MKKILLIDDDSSLRESIAEMLVLSDYSVSTAENGKIGIEKILKEQPDLILCDVMMPGLDGYSVLHILHRHPETKHIPFIFLTGKMELDDMRKGMSIGADDYLIKPFKEIDLLNAIQLRIRKHERQRKGSMIGKSALDELIQLANTDHKKDVYQYSKKHILYEENQHPSVIYYVLSGKLKEYKLNEDGKELILNMYTNGDFIGYRPILENINYSENLQVIEDAELLLIPKNNFLKFINDDITITWQFIRLLAQNIRRKEEKLLKMAYTSLRKKVASGIIEVADKFKSEKDGFASIEISRDDLAHVIGSAQESIIRTLKEFKTEKLIDVRDESIVVLNDQKLRTLAY